MQSDSTDSDVNGSVSPCEAIVKAKHNVRDLVLDYSKPFLASPTIAKNSEQEEEDDVDDEAEFREREKVVSRKDDDDIDWREDFEMGDSEDDGDAVRHTEKQTKVNYLCFSACSFL